MKSTLRTSLVFGSCVTLAGSLIGCVATNFTSVDKPTVNGPEVIDSSLSGNKQTNARFVIRFDNSAFKTQAAGSHHTEIRFLYTAGMLRHNDAKDYFFGLKNGGTAAAPYYTFAAATPSAPSINTTPTSVALSAGNNELPIFPSLSAPTCSTTVNPTAAASNYILPAGIWEVTGTQSIDPFEIATDDLDVTYADYSTLYGQAPLFTSAVAAFNNVFKATGITVYKSATKATVATTIPSPIANTTCAIKGTELTTDGQKTLCYRLILPAGVTSVDLGYIPAGRLLMDIRRFETADALTSYGYGTFFVNPGSNTTLDAGSLSATLTASQSIQF